MSNKIKIHLFINSGEIGGHHKTACNIDMSKQNSLGPYDYALTDTKQVNCETCKKNIEQNFKKN